MVFVTEHVVTSGTGNTGRLQLHADISYPNAWTMRRRIMVLFVASGGVTSNSNSFNAGFSNYFSNESGAKPISIGAGGSVAILDQTRDIPRYYNTVPSGSMSMTYSGLVPWPGVTFGVSWNWSGDPRPDEAPTTPSWYNNYANSPTEVRIEWNAAIVNGGDYLTYEWRVWDDETSWYSPRAYGDTTATGVTVPGVRADRRQYWGVVARTLAGNGSWQYSAWTNQGTSWFVDTPPNPPGIVVTSVSAATFLLTASLPSGSSSVDEYQIQSALPGGASGVTSSGVSHWREGLPRKTAYDYRARARTARGWSNWTTWYRLTTLPQVPVITSDYVAADITANSARLTNFTLSDNGGEAPTNVMRLLATNPAMTGATHDIRGGWADFALSGLALGTTYYYQIAAGNSAGWGPYGAVKSFTTLAGVPSDVAAPTFTSVTDTSFTANWTAPALNGSTLSHYQIQWSLSEDFTTIVGQTTTTLLNQPITGLLAGTDYWVRVRAVATPASGGWGQAKRKTTGIAPQSGMRVYMNIGGTMKLGELYMFIGGIRRRVKPMMLVDGVMQTE